MSPSILLTPYHSFAAAEAAGFDKSNLVAWYDLESNGDDSHTNELDLTDVGTISHVTGLVGNGADLDNFFMGGGP